ncbi:Rieske 2Fe-2S domain-containing protein [Novosphingobium sp. BL-52-GroH]|uniref:Rieske 2Fe-2S domain-containing protein n=1 Tax=Novosphingobium sp. BL-52-GroH TaxID=3349877 RepID=UPI00384C1D8F
MATAAVIDTRRPALPLRCTFDPEDWFVLARHWYPVALAREVGPKPIGTKLLDQPLVIYKSGDEVVVALDVCPHRGVPLSLGTQQAGGVVCAYHGLKFGTGGKCVHVPAHPARDIPERLNLTTYPSFERYGPSAATCRSPRRWRFISPTRTGSSS